jgi:hypothetical protein
MLLKLEYANYFTFGIDIMENSDIGLSAFVHTSFVGYDKNIDFEFYVSVEGFEENISFQLLNKISFENKIVIDNKFVVEEE